LQGARHAEMRGLLNDEADTPLPIGD